MKRMVSILMALIFCLLVSVPAYAANDTFVPSISYKDGPDIETGELEGEDVTDCLVVTSISDAKHKRTDITQPARDLLLDVYEKLNSGDMKLPIANDDYVIRELVDVSFRESDCILPQHLHKEELAKDGTTLEVVFDLGVKPTTEVLVLVYINNKWVPVDTVNNGDGTVTCEFENICPVVFCVEQGAELIPPKTGDNSAAQLLMWGGVLAVSLAAMLVLFILYKRSDEDEDSR